MRAEICNDARPTRDLSPEEVFFVLETMGMKLTHTAKEKLVEKASRGESLQLYFCPHHDRMIEDLLKVQKELLQRQRELQEAKGSLMSESNWDSKAFRAWM
jgi:hypothetical protein